MAFYPVNLDLTDRECVVIGGGKVAERKVLGLLQAGAKITVISPLMREGLTALAEKKEIVHLAKYYAQGDLKGFFLVICAADQELVNFQAAQEAKVYGALVNVVDQSYPSDFTVPAKVCRGDLLITVSTGGHSPALARQLRQELASSYGEEYGTCLELVSKLREQMKEVLPESEQRVLFWQKAMNQKILDLIRQGKLNKAEAEIRNAIGSFRAES